MITKALLIGSGCISGALIILKKRENPQPPIADIKGPHFHVEGLVVA